METENISKKLNQEYDDKISDYSKRMKTHDAKEKNSTITRKRSVIINSFLG